MAKDGGRCESSFKGPECMLPGLPPFELRILLGQEGKGLDDAGEVFDKPVVIISESHEGLYVSEFLGERPIHNCVDLFGVPLKAIGSDYDAEVFCSCFIKFTFLGFYLKTRFLY